VKSTFEDFLNYSKATKRYEGNITAESILNFLNKDENIAKMILASESRLPAISFIVQDIENFISDLDDGGFSGKMHIRHCVRESIKVILIPYGYGKIEGKRNVPGKSKGDKFSIGDVYCLDRVPRMKLKYVIREIINKGLIYLTPLKPK